MIFLDLRTPKNEAARKPAKIHSLLSKGKLRREKKRQELVWSDANLCPSHGSRDNFFFVELAD
jgi:hypothetical protein